MLSHSSLTTAQVLAAFTDEVAARGGRVTDTFHDGRRLFARSVLPGVEDVRPGDGVQGGVAVKATGDGVWVYPYVFRLVCRNGAVAAQTIASRYLGDLPQLEPDVALESVRDGVAACCAPEAFLDTVRKMRTACEERVDLALNLLPLLSRLPGGANAELLAQILDRFFQDGDRSRFGLANAVTAVARDTRDPDVRWNLEELGGAVAAGTLPRRPAGGSRAAAARPRRAASVGSGRTCCGT
jgi:hypothetical protein